MMSQLLKLAIEGNQTLRENKWEFTNRSTVKEVKYLLTTAKEKENILMDWISERCVLSNVETPKADLFRDMRDWHKRNGHTVFPDTLDKFGKAIRKLPLINVDSCRIKDIQCYRGIGFKKSMITQH